MITAHVFHEFVDFIMFWASDKALLVGD
jgi:hypothetical protein